MPYAKLRGSHPARQELTLSDRGVTEKEFQALLPHFEQAFEAYMGNRTIDGQPRTSRRYTTYRQLSLTHDG